MSKDEVIERLIQEGHDPDCVRREVGLAEVALKVEPDGWEVSDLWFLRHAFSGCCCVRTNSEPDNEIELEYEREGEANEQG